MLRARLARPIRGLAAACVALSVLFVAPDGQASDHDRDGRLRVLFIGNSYTRFNDLPHMVGELSRSVRGGPRLIPVREAHGGYDLRGHWRRRQTRARIASGRFDAVVLQGHSTQPLRHPEQFSEYVRRFVEHTSAAGARPILFQTWARHPTSPIYRRQLESPREMLARLDAAYRELGRALGVPVAPVGRAFARASEELPNVVLHREDGTHPAVAGSYLAACVLYATITGGDPRQATWRPVQVSRRQATRIRAIAVESL